MNFNSILYTTGIVIIIITVVIKILHLPGSQIAEIVSDFAFFAVFFALLWENKQLKKKVLKSEGAQKD